MFLLQGIWHLLHWIHSLKGRCLPYFQEGVKLQGSLSGRSWVCLCKAACQESTSPTGDVAAGCQFPLKSPGHDSGEALNVRCLSPPGGVWWMEGLPPNPGSWLQLPGSWQMQPFSFSEWRTVTLEAKSCWNEKRTIITALQAAIWLLLSFLESGRILPFSQYCYTLQLNTITVKIWLRQCPQSMSVGFCSHHNVK